jgi:DNA helicase HerA-like ATPase
MDDKIYIGGGAEAQYLLLKRANRHGLVAGATGTGKTVTLQILAEGFARAGVPVFAADVKSDLSGIGAAGALQGPFAERAKQIGLTDYVGEACPTVFWDLYGERGHPIRATGEEMGAPLLSRLLELSEAQEGALAVAFKMASEEGLPILDLKDLQSLLTATAERREELSAKYGLVSPQSIGAIQRKLLQLENEGADKFFGEPSLDLFDFMKTRADGKGYVNILSAEKLINSPRLYSTFLLWLLSELFEKLPEVGDPDKPKLVFFFDEAHLLFNDAPPALLQRIEQVVRLIRSKGVGVYFVTQSPADIPPNVLAQLGNRVQHALRAYTPTERKAIKAAAESFRPNPAFKTDEVITELGIGEALVSTLDAKGTPTEVQRTLVRPPYSKIGPIADAERAAVQQASPVAGKYDAAVDRVSAHEMLQKKAEQLKKAEAANEEKPSLRRPDNYGEDHRPAPKSAQRAPVRRTRQSYAETTVKQVGRSAMNTLVREVVKSLFGRKR